MSKTFKFTASFVAVALTHSSIFAADSVIFYGSDIQSESILAFCDRGCSRPRLNDHSETVWSQHDSIANEGYSIFSSERGLISSGFHLHDPDINNSGEVIWRFGDHGQGPNGIESNVRGVILASVHGDPAGDTQRINNNGEIIATRGGGVQGVWSNERGYLPTPPVIALASEVNDSGEVVYQLYSFPGNVPQYVIHSTERGVISSDSLWRRSPDINSHGEIVWQQRSNGFGSPFEIWSNIRGKIGDGENPSINDTGEVVWQFSDGIDYEIYSSTRGQLTSNFKADTQPSINNVGDVAWLRFEFVVPEPSTLFLLGIGAISLLGHRKAKP